MTSLHELLERSARSALARQDPQDGSLPSGCNGIYGDPETPARNTSHWLVTFAAAHRLTGERRFRDAVERAAAYLAAEDLRPGGATFWHRTSGAKDRCNGLIGQAWTLEALAVGAEILDSPELAKLAESVFLLHPFDSSAALWQKVDVDGRALGFDFTFNHQLWFAAAGALVAPLAGPEVGARVGSFLGRLDANLSLHRDGLVRHAVTPRSFLEREPRYTWRFLRDGVRHRAANRHRAVGYHAFNLHAFALLAERHAEYPFFRGRKFARALSHARSPGFRASLGDNPYAWPYNPSGFEMAFTLATFEPNSAALQADWVSEQIRRHYDFATNVLGQDTPDPATLSGRMCEAARLADLELDL